MYLDISFFLNKYFNRTPVDFASALDSIWPIFAGTHFTYLEKYNFDQVTSAAFRLIYDLTGDIGEYFING